MQYNQPPDRRPMSAANKMLIAVVVLMVFTAGGISILVDSSGRKNAQPTPTPTMAPSALNPGGELSTLDEALQSITPTPSPSPVVLVTAPPTDTPAPNFYMTPAPTDVPTLKINSSGDEVREMQKRLIELGYLKDGANDGQFGKGTQNAVKAFQDANGLGADGAAGPLTLKLLFSNQAKSKPK
ncbi:MAG: hypothetical protein GX781_04875 [Clostridiales bacterium]|nr:hypothetical protein [Clostridiales bacterium]